MISNPSPAAPSPVDFSVLQSLEGLQALDRSFLDTVEAADAPLHGRLLAYRDNDVAPAPLELSELMLALGPHLEAFLAARFGIENQLGALRSETLAESVVSWFKKEFVMKRAKRYRDPLSRSFRDLDRELMAALGGGESGHGDRELAIARFAKTLCEDEDAHSETLTLLVQWCVRARTSPEGRSAVRGWSSFRLPQPVDQAHLVPLHDVGDDPIGRRQGDPTRFRPRDGFALTDTRMSLRETMAEVHYCVFCHDHDGDFCSKGFPEKKKQPELGLKVNPLGVVMTGCPLEEKISEMHALKRDGHTLAALAVAMVDNPMVPATGHRICNDCMKGCIYQKQDPVNIPQIETRVLTDVLELPWGVEIYHLLTRWNPLRRTQYLPAPYNGRRVLISGMGPAGFTMAHHLTMEGCAVVGIDGLKIEPLPQELLDAPVRNWSDLCQALDERIMAGFGGVAEYGITVRWDKNFLTLIYLTLARRANFQVFGGVRLGGTITVEDAWALGFDHVCSANGAGYPRVIPMGNSLARGMRQANDFLMALQLTGAAKSDSLANLQVRLPAVVIGGGLTAVDTATEVQAYYIKQVEKVLHRYEELVRDYGEDHVVRGLDEENRIILEEFLEHGRAVRDERQQAQEAGREPDFTLLLRDWGGVTLVYRKGMNESPAYQRNHEEVVKALEEGVYYLEGLEPVRVELDRFGHVQNLHCRKLRLDDGRWLAAGQEREVPARAVFVAAGTLPNTIYEHEHPGTFALDGDHFLPNVIHRSGMQPVGTVEHVKAGEFGPFTSYDSDGRRVSFIGDSHPVFNGSVVKAIASASRSYPQVMSALAQLPARDTDDSDGSAFQRDIAGLLDVHIDSVRTDQHGIIEIRVHAPLAARRFQPGQFFRLQTFESLSPLVHGTRLQIPLQTVSGAGVDGDYVRLMLLPWGANARIAARLKPGERAVLMGPTGIPTEMEPGKTVAVVAGSWGAAVMLGLGPVLRANGNRIVYFAAYPDAASIYCRDELEAGADRMIWALGNGEKLEGLRPQDRCVSGGDLISHIERYGRGELDSADDAHHIPLQQVDHVLVMGSTNLLRGFQTAMKDRLSDLFRSDVEVTGTVGSPMQCMLKGVCAQCLQWQIDPDTGERTRAVFSCAMQDQPLAWIDLDNLADRQSQNRLQEHLTNLWVQHVLKLDSQA